MEHESTQAWQDGGGDGTSASELPIWVARLQERLTAGDRLYHLKFETLERRIGEVDERVKAQQKWIQGTAILVALEVLGLIVSVLAGWRPG